MRRFLLLTALVIAVPACSSEDSAAADTGPQTNACVASGLICAVNFPFKCPPGQSPVTDGKRATACGKSDGTPPVAISCCAPNPPEDTGPGPGDADADVSDGADAPDGGDGGDASDGGDVDSGDASDASDGGDARDGDASDGG